MNINFHNQNILITGGTKGIGKKLVQDFSLLGGNVWFTGRDKSIKDKNYLSVDFQDENQMNIFLDKIQNINFDVVINNAGTNKIGSLESYDNEDYDKIINLNLSSCYKIMKTVIPQMRRKNYGKIINVTSIQSEICIPLRSAYCSSKFGLLGLTKSSAVELAKHNILVNSVAPGVIQTDLTKNILGKNKMDEIAENLPIGRLGTVNDISNTVLFMSSKFNTYIVGQNIIVDGGYTCV